MKALMKIQMAVTYAIPSIGVASIPTITTFNYDGAIAVDEGWRLQMKLEGVQGWAGKPQLITLVPDIMAGGMGMLIPERAIVTAEPSEDWNEYDDDEDDWDDE